MRAPGNLALVVAGTLLAGLGIAACSLDLGGLPGEKSSATTTGAGGAITTSSAGGTGGRGGAGGSPSSTSSAGGSGGAPVCGNNKLEAEEACDDGNVAIGDGCSPTCTLEPLDACPGLPLSLTPSGITIVGQLISTHDELKPSCSASNSRDVVYEVTPTESGTLKVTLTGEYDKSLSVRSSCLDGPNVELGCDAGQGAIVQRYWVHAGVKYYVVVDAGGDIFSLQLGLSACGDGVQQELEECDDPTDTSCIGCLECTGNNEVRDPASGHCYLRTTGPQKDWKGARADCLAWHGDLVGISSQVEANFLRTKFDNVWSGANDIVDECSFNWINGEPWQPHWGVDEPNNNNNEDCALFYGSGLMNDTSCNDHRDALCERAPAGSCGDGLLQPGEECDDKITYAHLKCNQCVLQCPVGETESPTTHHCYRAVLGTNFDWNAAKEDCAATGAYLAVITSPAENAWLQASLTGPMWIGVSRTGNNADFKWINSDALKLCFANWDGAPSNDGNKNCGVLQVNGTWSNDDCKQKRGYICERDN